MAGTDPALGGEPPSVVVSEVDPLVGHELGGYRVTKLLASGGMGLVYEAMHETIGRRAAVKVLKPEVAADAGWTKRFLSEARALGALKHRNLIEVINFGKTPDGREYLMMEFLEGEPLDAYIARLGALPPAVALGIAEQVLNGLAEAHKKGVVHRDLKPSNVYLLREHNGELLVKVLDFGLARQEPVALVDVAVALPKRDDGASLLAGTPEYIAPEQAQGRKVDATADLYALGVMLFEMLTGRLPFEADSVVALLQKHLSERPPKLKSLVPALSDELEDFVDALLEKEPERRPGSADAARVTVQRLLRQLSQDATAVRAAPRDATAARYAPTAKIVRPPPATAVSEPLVAPREPRAGWIAAIAALVLLLAGAVWWTSARTPAPPPAPLASPLAADAPMQPLEPRVLPEPAPVAPEPAEVAPAPVAPASAVEKPALPRPPSSDTKVKRPTIVIERPKCEPTAEWRQTIKADLNELGARAASDEALYALFRTEGSRVSRLADAATTGSDCAEVTAGLERLAAKILKR